MAATIEIATPSTISKCHLIESVLLKIWIASPWNHNARVSWFLLHTCSVSLHTHINIWALDFQSDGDMSCLFIHKIKGWIFVVSRWDTMLHVHLAKARFVAIFHAAFQFAAVVHATNVCATMTKPYEMRHVHIFYYMVVNQIFCA